ncbi:hypothetical protein L21SP2_3218 [Salinispira pacifica]|uniref:Uncharacterized protein n=1 Tax=Salinispira pacifica TaxID=1307761 RepID=V5WLR7_9SPIO|nr:hypothetical protein L21SP2_3218 [Salinispira pacifica]
MPYSIVRADAAPGCREDRTVPGALYREENAGEGKKKPPGKPGWL